MPEALYLDYVTLDVFTDRKFGGNPLAVVLDGTALATAQMQAIAAEFNYAETTFVLPPKDPQHTAEVRIFTPRAEMPFAGHPNIGTAYALALARQSVGLAVPEQFSFEEKAGLVILDLRVSSGRVVGARLAAPQPVMRGRDVASEIVAAACLLAPGDITVGRHAPCIASCGAPFIFAELKTRAALKTAAPRAEVFAAITKIDEAVGVLLYTRDGGGGFDLHVRMFAPLLGVPEDPATGSGNVALAGLLATLDPAPDLTLRLRISQGVDMGRPSVLEASAEKRNGAVTGLWIEGSCVPMMRGVVAL